MRGRSIRPVWVALPLALAMLAGPAAAGSAAPMPTPGGAVGVASDGTVVYALGGADSYGGSGTRNILQIYSVSSGTWSQGAPLPDTNGWGPGTVVVDGKLYAVGGWSAGGGLLRRYDPATGQWTSLTGPTPASFTWAHATVAVGNSIYAVGGTAGASMSRYDIATDTWTPLAPALYSASDVAVTDTTHIYVMTHSGAMQIYDIAANQWTEGPHAPVSFDGPSTALANGVMFVFGGQSGTQEDVVYGFDLGAQVWRRYPAGGQLWSWSGATLASDGIHVLGGFTLTGPSSDHLVFDPATAPLPDDPRCEEDPTAECGTDDDDDLQGTPDADVIFGGDGNDTIASGEGDDEVAGDAGDDELDTGGGNDVADGGTGNDRVFARAGNDLAKGGAGNDLLDMAEGLDRVNGGGGRDTIDGGAGFDTINGGAGFDTCYFSSRREKLKMKSCEKKIKRAH